MKRFAIFAAVILLGIGCYSQKPAATGSTSVPTDEPAATVNGQAPDETETSQPDRTGLAEPEAPKLDKLPADSKLCTDPPTPTDIGREEYPKDPKYRTLSFLGEFFTAARCGNDRAENIFGVRDGVYTLGSSIALYGQPNAKLLNTLKWIGYECAEGDDDAKCVEWGTDKNIPIEDLLLLEQYSGLIRSDDCISCG